MQLHSKSTMLVVRVHRNSLIQTRIFFV